VEAIFPVPIQTGTEDHTAYRTKMCTVFLYHGVKRPGRGTNHTSPLFFLLNFITQHVPFLWIYTTCIEVNFYIFSSTNYFFHSHFWFLIYLVIFTHWTFSNNMPFVNFLKFLWNFIPGLSLLTDQFADLLPLLLVNPFHVINVCLHIGCDPLIVHLHRMSTLDSLLFCTCTSMFWYCNVQLLL